GGKLFASLPASEVIPHDESPARNREAAGSLGLGLGAGLGLGHGARARLGLALAEFHLRLGAGLALARGLGRRDAGVVRALALALGAALLLRLGAHRRLALALVLLHGRLLADRLGLVLRAGHGQAATAHEGQTRRHHRELPLEHSCLLSWGRLAPDE